MRMTILSLVLCASLAAAQQQDTLAMVLGLTVYIERELQAHVPRVPLGRQVFIADMIILSDMQALSPTRVKIGPAAAEILYRHFDLAGPALMGGRPGRQAGSIDNTLLETLDNEERRTWSDLDERLGAEKKLALQQAFPALLDALFKFNPHLQHSLISSRVFALQNLKAVSEEFGVTTTETFDSLARLFLKMKICPVCSWGGQRLQQELNVIYALLSLGRYLDEPVKCQSVFETR